MLYYCLVAKEVHMALPKQDHHNHSQPHSPCQSTPDGELETDLADFEHDESLRKLRLEQWFATAEPGVPMWCY
jgi:hypothetical protein